GYSERHWAVIGDDGAGMPYRGRGRHGRCFAFAEEEHRNRGRYRSGHRGCYPDAMDHLAAALARVVAGVLYQWSAYVRCPATVAVPTVSVVRIRFCGVDGRLSFAS